MKTLGIFPILLLSVLLAACGGGGGSSPNMPPVIPPLVLTPSSTETIDNTRAIDPLPSFKAVQLPTFDYFDYRKEVDDSPVPDFIWYTAPGVELQNDYVPMTHRAFKLWSRRIGGLIDVHPNQPHRELEESGTAQVHILSGYDQPNCGGGQGWACGSHYGTTDINPTDRPNANTIPATIYAPIFFERTTTSDGRLTADGFRIIVHEFGHVLDHQGIGVGEGETHTDCLSTGTVGVMCDEWDGAPITVTEQDFDGIQHHYQLKGPSNYEVFGIWATVRNENSNLNEFGVRVTRTLSVNAVLAPDRNQPIEDLIQDQILVETMISGTTSAGPVAGMGTATWSGDLIAVDTSSFQPVLGAADLSMDLENVDVLEAHFTDMSRTDDAGMLHDITDASYTLMKSGSTYVDAQGMVDANFYAVGTDDAGAVAGRLDDSTRNLMGAYGALRD